VPGEIRRGVGQFRLAIIPGAHDALVSGAIFLIAAEKFPGESLAFKLV